MKVIIYAGQILYNYVHDILKKTVPSLKFMHRPYLDMILVAFN